MSEFVQKGNAFELSFKERTAEILLVDGKPTLKTHVWDTDKIWLQYPAIKPLTYSSEDDRLTAPGMEWKKTDGETLKWLFYFTSKPAKNTYTLDIKAFILPFE